MATRRHWRLVAAVVAFGVLACDDPGAPLPSDTTHPPITPPVVPPTPPPAPTVHALRPGETSTLAAHDSLLIGLELQAGDTVDFGIFAESSNLITLDARVDTRFESAGAAILEQLRLTGTTGQFAGGGGTLVVPALIAPVAGRTVVLVRGTPWCAGGPPGSCNGRGTVDIELRKSRPVVSVSSRQGYLSYMIRQGSEDLDSLFVRNAGGGNISVQLSVGSPFSVGSDALSLAGPDRTSADGVSIALRTTAATPGDYSDTIRVAGAPGDRFNRFAPGAIGVHLRVFETTATRRDVGTYYSHVAVSPSGLVVVGEGSRFLKTLDAVTGATVPFATLPGAITGPGRGMTFTSDGTLYVVAYVNPHWTLLKRSPSGEITTVHAGMPSADYAVLPDGTIYILASGDSARLLRLSQPNTTPHVIESFGTAYHASGVVFDPRDSSIFYGVRDTLWRRDLRSGTSRALGARGGHPFAIDDAGRMYLAGVLSPVITEVDGEGTFLRRRYPPAWSTTSWSVGSNLLMGISGSATWTLPTP
jgi:hypothetical protein